MLKLCKQALEYYCMAACLCLVEYGNKPTQSLLLQIFYYNNVHIKVGLSLK